MDEADFKLANLYDFGLWKVCVLVEVAAYDAEVWGQ
jgi:hypothetical protein